MYCQKFDFMIRKESYTIEWITRCSKENKNADKILVEKVIMALHLLEELKLQNLNFIFKGGSSLMLLLEEPKRFSIDIDIILDDKSINLVNIFANIIEKSNFIRFKEDKRESISSLDKVHYKFYYNPVTSTRGNEEYILLDILFEKHKYAKTISLPIALPFVIVDNNETLVNVPDVNCILGDKLTAFAPNTTGVRYKKGKEIEIIKQLFDIGILFDNFNDIALTEKTFNGFAEKELEYRSLCNKTYIDVLNDIVETALTIAYRGRINPKNYAELGKGIKNIVNYIFLEKYHIDIAIMHASKAAYLAALIKSNSSDVERFEMDINLLKGLVIENTNYNKLNKLKGSNIEAFYYWFKTIELLY